VAVLDLFVAGAHAYVVSTPERWPRSSEILAYLRRQPGIPSVVTPINPLHLEEGEPVNASASRYASLVAYPEFNTPEHIRNFDPYTGMVAARQKRFLRRSGGARAATSRLGLWGVEYAVIPLGPEIASQAGLHGRLEVVAHDAKLRTYLVRLPHRPRAYLAQELRSVDRREAMEFALSADPAGTSASVIEGPVPPDHAPPQGEVVFLADDPERIVLETRADRLALVVLNDVFAPGWSATVDGAPAEILPANYLARGVWVDAGTHRLVFRYRTPGLAAGWLVFALGVAAAVGALVIRRRLAPADAAEAAVAQGDRTGSASTGTAS
jgi:hypothetical protein